MSGPSDEPTWGPVPLELPLELPFTGNMPPSPSVEREPVGSTTATIEIDLVDADDEVDGTRSHTGFIEIDLA